MLKTCIIERFEQSNKHVVAICHRMARACCYEQLLLGLRSTELHRKKRSLVGCIVHLGKAERGCRFGAAKYTFSMITQQVLDSFLTKKAVCFPTGSKVISREVTSGTVLIYRGFLLRASVTSAIGYFEW